MTSVLGISAFYHDSAAALIVDGQIVAAAQEERFTRKKHDAGFPARAVEYCLAEAKLSPEEIDFVGFYDKPFLKFERLLETYLAYAPVGFRSFLSAMPLWLKQKLHLRKELERRLPSGKGKRRRVVFTEHHESHAASAFFASPFDEAAILTVDGVGEWATASFGVGRGDEIELSHELHFPHSLGLLYSAFTYFCGFKVNSGEYKLMGLAPYGQPRYADLILQRLVDLKDDGSLRLDLSYFNYCQGLTMTGARFDRLFGGPPRKPESPLTEREMDLAASIQVVAEEAMLRMARHVHRQTGQQRLCLAGGVALNCVANGRISREGPFDEIWIQPAAGDAGGALGAALFIWRQLLKKPLLAKSPDAQRGSLLGPRFDEPRILAFLDSQGAVYRRYETDEALCDAVADLIAAEMVVGWVQGRMEFGPRALGARSILGDARSRRLQAEMNLKIKFRESFRPFAPVVLEADAPDWFETTPGQTSPYMLLVAPVLPQRRLEITDQESEYAGLDRRKAVRSTIPAVTHVDCSARLQTVDAVRNPRLHLLLQSFKGRTGVPVMINTSFNVRGEPIVCTPEEAWRCFIATNMDALVLERIVLLKREQPAAQQHSLDQYLAEFQLD